MANFWEKLRMIAGRMTWALFSVVLLFSVLNPSKSFADSDYVCPVIPTYSSCNSGYYLSDCGNTYDGRTISSPAAGNSCTECPSGYLCDGGAVCPRADCTAVTLRALNDYSFYDDASFPDWTNTTMYYKSSNGYFYSDSTCSTRQYGPDVTPEKLGYEFDGWVTIDSTHSSVLIIDDDGVYVSLANPSTNLPKLIASNYTLQPTWSCVAPFYDAGEDLSGDANGVCVATRAVFNKDGGTGGDDAIYLEQGGGNYIYNINNEYIGENCSGSEADLVIPTKTGYNFDGYYSAASGGTQYVTTSGCITTAGYDNLYDSYSPEGNTVTWYAHWSPRQITCSAGYYLPANSTTCSVCPAGRYCAGGTLTFNTSSNVGLTDYIAAGYYSTGGATRSKPTAAGNGCLTGYSCGIVAGGYYSTGGGTSATPTGPGNGCLDQMGEYYGECGKIDEGMYSTGGAASFNPDADDNANCVAGQQCGLCGEYASSPAGSTYCTCYDGYVIGGGSNTATYDPVNDPAGETCELRTVTVTIKKDGGTGSLSVSYISYDSVASNSGTSDAVITCVPGNSFEVDGVDMPNATMADLVEYSGSHGDGASSPIDRGYKDRFICPQTNETWRYSWNCDTGYSDNGSVPTSYWNMNDISTGHCLQYSRNISFNDATQYGTQTVVEGQSSLNNIPQRTGYTFAGAAINCSANTNSAIASLCNDNNNFMWMESDGTIFNVYDYGWYLEQNLREAGDLEPSVPASYTIPFTVTWNPAAYTVQINANGGTAGTTTSVTATYGAAMPTIAAANLPKRRGYMFAGFWDTNAATGGNMYYKADGTSNANWNKTDANPVLYARWTANTVTCDAGQYLSASTATCAACPAGKYCMGNNGSSKTYTYDGTDQGITGNVAAGYYSAGGCKVSNPTSSSNYISGGDCGLVGNGFYSAGGATRATPGAELVNGRFNALPPLVVDPITGLPNEADAIAYGCLDGASCGIVAAGYYNTGGGTSARPTAAGNGCLTGNQCGQVAAGYYNTGGGTSATPVKSTTDNAFPTVTYSGCLGGFTCGAVSAGYYGFAGATSATPYACPEGSYSAAGASECTACPGGKTTSGTGTAFNTNANTTCSVTCPDAVGVTEWFEPYSLYGGPDDEAYDPGQYYIDGLCVPACRTVTLKRSNQMNYGGANYPGLANDITLYKNDEGDALYSDSSCSTYAIDSDFDVANTTGYNFQHWQYGYWEDGDGDPNFSDYNAISCEGGGSKDPRTCSVDDDMALQSTGYTLEPYWTCATGYSMSNNNGICVANTSTVTLKNGNTTVDTVTATYDAAMPTKNTSNANLTMPTSTKAVFTGYYDQASGGTQYYTAALASARTWNKTGAQNLYAHFTNCTCGTDTNATCTVMETSNNTCQFKHTCTAGYYHANNGDTITSNSVTCTPASDGYFAKAGATAQTACAVGSYSTASSASSTCTACPGGRTTSGTGTHYNANANTACATTCSNASGVTQWLTPRWYSDNTVGWLCEWGCHAVTMQEPSGNFTDNNYVPQTVYFIKNGYNGYSYWDVNVGEYNDVPVYADSACSVPLNATDLTIYDHLLPGVEISGVTNNYICSSGNYGSFVTSNPLTLSNYRCTSTAIENGWVLRYTTSCTNGYEYDENLEACEGYKQSEGLDPNEGTGGSSTLYFKYGTGAYLDEDYTMLMSTSANPITIPTRTGYHFDGYYLQGEYSNSDSEYFGYWDEEEEPQIINENGYITSDGIEFAQNFFMNSGMSIYARWTAQTSTVTLNANGGTNGTTTSVTATYDAPMPTIAAANLPKRAGYVFAGFWDTNAATGGNKYYNADGTSNADWDMVGDQTLYARWTQCAANSYCPGDNTTHTCASGTNNKYPSSAAGATTVNDCYLTTTAGNYVETAGDGQVACSSGDYCTGGATIYSGGTHGASHMTTGGNASCAAIPGTNGLYPESDEGAESANNCYTYLWGQYIATAGAGVATNCPNWTFTYGEEDPVYYGDTSTCRPCPALTSGWSKKDSTSTGWGDATYCVEVHTPTNCASGTTKKVAEWDEDNEEAVWGSEVFDTTLTARAGYYAGSSATSCTICPAGSYCPAGATAATACAVGSYTSTTGRSQCTACTNGTTTSAVGATSCDATCSNNAHAATWTATTWNSNNNTVSNACTLATCATGYSVNNNVCTVNSYTVTLNANGGTNGTTTSVTATYGAAMPTIAAANLPKRAGYVFAGFYDTNAATGGNMYYKADGTSNANWNKTDANPVLYARWTQCAANSYCPGDNTTHTCASGTNNKYPSSAAGTSTVNDCYLTTTAGKYVETAGNGEEGCLSGSYCPGGTTIYYGGTYSVSHRTTGGMTICPEGSFCAVGATAPTQCAVGSYSDAGESECVACRNGTTTSAAGAISCDAACPNASGVEDWAGSKWNDNNTVTNLCKIDDCDENYYLEGNACTSCATATNNKYPRSDRDSESINSCYVPLNGGQMVVTPGAGAVACPVGKYCIPYDVFYDEISENVFDCPIGSYNNETGKSACIPCQNGTTTSAEGQTSCNATCSNATGVQSGSAGWEEAYWDDEEVENVCTIKKNGCIANYYHHLEDKDYNSGCVSCASLTNNKYTQSVAGAFDESQCYLTTTAGNYVATTGAGQVACPAGSYCPGGDTVYYSGCLDEQEWDDETETEGNGYCDGFDNIAVADWHTTSSATTCASQTNNKYPSSAAGTTTVNDCYLTTTAGMHVATTGAGQVACSSGDYCTGGTTIYYGGTHSASHMTTGGNASCAAIPNTNGLYPRSDSDSSVGASSPNDCYTATGTLSGKYIATAGAGTATNCPNWTFHGADADNEDAVHYGETSSCTPCPALTAGWSKKDSTTTGWTGFDQCVQIITPEGCASGTIKETPELDDELNWGSEAVDTALSASPGYYVEDTSCRICSSGQYCPGGTASATECTTGSYTNTEGQSQCTPCQNGTTTTGEGATSCDATCSNSANVRADGTPWATATWNSDNTVTNACTLNNTACAAKYYYDNNACSACPAGAAYKPTYPASYYVVSSGNPGVISGVGVTSIAGCRAQTSITSERGLLFDQSSYNTTTNKYDIVTNILWYEVNPGYYLTNKGSCGTYAYYREANECPAGSYCPGKDQVVCNSTNAATVHTTTFGLNSCADDTDYYPNSAAGATSIGKCYLTTISGEYVFEPGRGQTGCDEGSYCPGGVDIYYNSDGGETAGGSELCSAIPGTNGLYSHSNLDAGGPEDCFIEDLSGQYIATAGAGVATNCPNWTFNPPTEGDSSRYIYYGQTSSCTPCPALTSGWSKKDSTATGWSSEDQCVEVHTPANCASGTTKKVAAWDENGEYLEWGSEVFDTTLTASAGYYAGSSATSCTICPAGSFCLAGATAPTACTIGSFNYQEGQTECVSCSDRVNAIKATKNALNIGLVEAIAFIEQGRTTSAAGATYCDTLCPNGSGVAKRGWVQEVWTTANTLSQTCTIQATGCTSDYFKNGNACTSCATATNNKYPNSDAGNQSIDACYVELVAGEAVESYGAGATDCPSGSYCAYDGAVVYYDEQMPSVPCAIGSFTPDTGYSECLACNSTAGVNAQAEETGLEASTFWGRTTSAAGATSCDVACPNALDSEDEDAVNGWATSTWEDNTVSNVCVPNSCKRDHYLDSDNGVCPRCDSFANGLYPYSPSNNTNGQTSCYLRTSNIPGYYIASDYAEEATPCPLATYSAGSQNTVVHYGEKSSCKSCPDNTYADTEGSASCTACAENYSTAGGGVKNNEGACRIYCAGGSYLSDAYDTSCTNVGAGYWAAGAYVRQGESSTKTQCSTGLTTAGYGVGADEAADCGRKLHVGNNVIYLRSVQKTTPSLHVKVDGTTFFGNMSTEEIGHMRVKYNNVKHSVYDDLTEATGDNTGGESGSGGGSQQPSITINPATPASATAPAYNAATASTQSWTATVGNVNLEGAWGCSATSSSTLGDLSATGWSPEGSGTSCWCKITSPATATRWAYTITNANCSSKCAAFCAQNMTGAKAKNITYRTNLYTAAGIATQ